ncbi:MAG: carotenoid biosynthesis protein [Ignavibacteria bacterium]
MEKQKTLNIFHIIIYIFFAVGAAGHFIAFTKPVMLYMTPYVLAIAGVFVLGFSGSIKNNKFILFFIISFLMTFTLEVAGVKTGMIFGKYTYGDVLGYKVAAVPVIIGFNWIFVILGALNIGIILSRNTLFVCLAAGILSVVFDMLLEPAAINLDYWSWHNIVVPFQNYAAWFIISFIFSFSFLYFKVNVYSKTFIHYFIAQLMFFIILNYY